MGAYNYRHCLSGNAVNSGILSAYYEFSESSGNVIYNSVHSTPAHYHQGLLIGSKNPGIFIRSGSSLPNALTGNLGGEDVFEMGDVNPKEVFSFLVDYDTDFCKITGNKSNILVSSLIDGTGRSGFAFGFNQSNRLFFEYYNNESLQTGIHTFNKELSNKNTVILSSPGNGVIDLGFYDYETEEFKGSSFSIPGYVHSDRVFWGGLNRYSGVDHSGFSGSFNRGAYFTGYLPDDIKKKCVDCLFSTGVTTDNTTGDFNVFRVTGFNFSSVGDVGITGYAYNSVSIPHPTGGSTLVLRESGLTGVLNARQVVTPLTGLIGTGESIVGALNFNIDYSGRQEYGIKNISFLYPLFSGDVLEVYSYPRPQKNLNILSQDFFLNKSGYSHAQLSHNGILNTQDIDYRLIGNYFVGESIQGYDSSDSFYYNLINENVIPTIFSGLWSGSKILLNEATSGTGANYFPNQPQYLESGTDIIITGISGTVVTGYDMFLNGQKLTEGFSYENTFSGSTPVLKLFGSFLPSFRSQVTYTGSFVSGYPNYPPLGISEIEPDLLVFVQKITGVPTNRVVKLITGEVSSVTITGYSEQVWVNGVKQARRVYGKTYSCSPTSGEFEYAPAPFLFYNNGNSYLNIE